MKVNYKDVAINMYSKKSTIAFLEAYDWLSDKTRKDLKLSQMNQILISGIISSYLTICKSRNTEPKIREYVDTLVEMLENIKNTDINPDYIYKSE